VVTGNSISVSSAFDYSNSVIKLSWDLSTVESYFAPSNWVSLNATDTDLGSVGAALLPSMGVVVAVGKEGVAYLLRADQLGSIGGEVASLRVCSGSWGGTAWSGSTVFIPCADGLVALSVSPTAIAVAWKVAHPVLGSPIVAAGAVWAIEPSSGKLYALDPVLPDLKRPDKAALEKAMKGHILAQATLGAYYWAGRGVPQDLTKAYYWSVLAQAGGDQASKYRVAVLASRMSRSQVLAAQQQANDWLSNFASHPPASP